MGNKKSSNKKKMGCLSRTIILFIVLVLVLFVAGKIFFPKETVKAQIIEKASEALNRPVELDDVSFSLLPLPSLTLDGFRIYNPEAFPGAEFVSVEKLECGLKILPLLKKRFEFSKISLVHPIIRLRKSSDGRVNYSFEIDAGEIVDKPVGTKETISSEEAALTAFAFDWAEINNGDIIYVDDSTNTRITINNFSLETRLHLEDEGNKGRSSGNLTIPSFSADYIPDNLPLNVDLSYNAEIDFQNGDLLLDNTKLILNGIPFDIEATIRDILDPVSVFAIVKTDGVTLEPLLQYLPLSEKYDKELVRLSGKLSGALETRIEIKSKREPYFSGSFDFEDLTLGYENISGRAHFESLKINFDSDSISFSSTGGQLSENPLSLSGWLKEWDDLRYYIETRGEYNLAGVTPFLDESMNHELTGLASFDIKAGGKKSDWEHTSILGDIAINKLYYNNDSLTSPLDRLDLYLAFGQESISVDSLYAEYPGVELSLTGKIKNGLAHLLQPRRGYPKPQLDFKLSSPLINYDILLPEVEEAIAQAETIGQPGESGSSLGGEVGSLNAAPIFIPDIEASGEVKIGQFIFRELDFTNISGIVKYENGVISYNDIRANIYSGNVTATGAVDITDMYSPLVTSEFSGENIEANGFLTQFAGIEDKLFGKVNVDGRLAGRGSEPEDFIKSVSAEGNLLMNEGKVINLEIIEKMAEPLGFKTFEEEKIRNLATDFIIRDGKILLEGAKVITRVGDWDVDGTVEFINKALDMQVGLYLSKEYSQQAKGLAEWLADENGRIRANFNVTGTAENPKISNFSTDKSAVKDKVEDNIKEEANKLFDKLFKKK